VVVKLLLYKVVELSNVDEASLERTVNQWVREGWNLDGVQFAMRESSKRPAMAFVFFTREGEHEQPGRSEEEAERSLRKMAEEPIVPARQKSAWDRLAEMAGDDEDEQ
jgi:hypothetical protein